MWKALTVASATHALNEHWFVDSAHARRIIEDWRVEYNTERPHSSLGDLTPEQLQKTEEAILLTADSNSSRYSIGEQVIRATELLVPPSSTAYRRTHLGRGSS